MRTLYSYTVLPLLYLGYILAGQHGVQIAKLCVIVTSIAAIALLVQILAAAVLPAFALALSCYGISACCAG